MDYMNTSVLPSPSIGCSAFCIRASDDVWIAKNLDVPFSQGHILSNHRGVSKQSLAIDHGHPKKWVSRWGGFTINLIGVDLPIGGINERGLVVEHLWMPETIYPFASSMESMLEFEWIQFALDTCACIDDVLEQVAQLSIIPGRVGMHFLLGGSDGACALLEFHGGRAKVYAGSDFQPEVVTNSWYEESVRHLSSYVGFGAESQPSQDSNESLDRFSRLACAIRNHAPVDAQKAPDLALRYLGSVIDSTLISSVFNPAKREMIYRSSMNSLPRTLMLDGFEFSPNSPRLMLNIHDPVERISIFDAEEISSSMRENLSVGGEFLNLGCFEDLMLDKQDQHGESGLVLGRSAVS